MLDRGIESVDCNVESNLIPCTYETNWTIAHGSLESSVAVESSDCPIVEPDLRFTVAQPPLILKPRGSDSGPCEIKICFKQKYEVGQIYIRSSARAYEIYYVTSPHSISEYLSTVRCGVAERDDKVLQTSCVAVEHGECSSGDLIAESASSGESAESATSGVSTVNSEDDWVKIKVPGAGGSPASDKSSTSGLKNIQELYEATAQISDLDPCLSLTIRLLSLQDKGYVYVDEIYVFVDPVQSTDSGNDAILAGSSAQSSLMAMFMPTLLQLSKSGVNRAQGTHASDQVRNNGKIETTSTVNDKIDSPQQVVKPKEVGKDTAESAESQSANSVKKCVDTKTSSSSQPCRLETAMEELTSRLSKVEDIFLRFEEKMLKPIERIDARLQQVEHQLEKLAKSSLDFGLPHCTRISAPEFSCSESNLSSFYDELEKKDVACDNIPGLSHEAKFHPGLIISAPEFSYGEDDEDNDNPEPLKESPQMKPKKTLLVDDALEAALHGFLSTAINPSKPIQTPIGLYGNVNEGIQNEGPAVSCQVESREVPAAENDHREPSQYAQVFSVKAPEFTEEETGCEEQLNSEQSTLDVAPVTEKKDCINETILPSVEGNSPLDSADSHSFGRKETTNDFSSASDGDSSAVSVMYSRTCLDEHLKGSSVVNIETFSRGDTSIGLAETSSAKHSRGNSMLPNSQETNPGKLTSCKPDDQDVASEENSEDAVETVSEDLKQIAAVQSIKGDAEHASEPSHVPFLDLEFPILEVRFDCDVHTSTKAPLEALLDGTTEPNTEAPSIISKEIDPVSTNGDETTDLPTTNGLLLDFEVSATDVSSHLEMAASLIE